MIVKSKKIIIEIDYNSAIDLKNKMDLVCKKIKIGVGNYKTQDVLFDHLITHEILNSLDYRIEELNNKKCIIIKSKMK